MATSDVQKHYENTGLMEAILAGLAEIGKDPQRLTPEDLAAVDEFHIRGREATEETAALAGLEPGCHVLDVGAGIGGPSRYLAHKFGLKMTGLDLCAPYCHVASELARRTGLEDRVEYRQGDATALPFDDFSFDAVWTQHASMNIENKGALYREMARVVRPGGRVVIYDIHKRGDEPIHFPVPWARTPDISFLCHAETLCKHLEDQGLEPLHVRDDTEPAHRWFVERMAQAAKWGPQPLGLHVLLGADWPSMATNVARNLEEERIGVIQTVWRKP